MKRIYAVIVLAVLGALATTAAPVMSGNGPACVLNTQLAGANEVPRGTSDATGHAQVKVWGDGTIAWKVHILNKDHEGIRAGHIHEAPVGVSGPIRVPLFETATPVVDKQFRDRGEKTIDAARAADICANPDQYYVNYHSTENAPGMARGQLG